MKTQVELREMQRITRDALYEYQALQSKLKTLLLARVYDAKRVDELFIEKDKAKLKYQKMAEKFNKRVMQTQKHL